MSKSITGCVVAAPLSAERAKLMIELLQRGELRREGIAAEITVRERRPDDTDDMLQSVNGIRRKPKILYGGFPLQEQAERNVL